MLRLSAVIITYNEERNIARCLDSLQGVADEIIVVDSYSTDRTKEICETYQVRFIPNSFEDYIQQKNFANSYASFDYVLSLDADEALSDELRASISAWKSSKPKADAWTMNRRNNYCGKWIWHSGWYPDRKLRLWKRNKARWGGNIPHEKIMLEKHVITSHLNGDILHWSYANAEEHEERLEKYAQLAALNMKQRGVRFNKLRLIYKPRFRFFKHYILKLGFLDGREGYQIARLSAKEVHRKYSLLR